MGKYPFGNDPAKIARYRAFWNRDAVTRPLVGFTRIGWFPFDEFAPCRSWDVDSCLTADRIDPEAFLPDHLRMLREGDEIDDDLIRGACPGQVAIPWLPGMLDCRVRILPHNALGEERRLSLGEALQVRLDRNNPWFLKYLAFAESLARDANGTFPVSHSAELGPTDLHALLRSHGESVLDLLDEPEQSAELLSRLAGICGDVTEELWKRVPLFHGGYFDAQYSLWGPDPIIRMQEDATAIYSPHLYRRFVQPVDRELASRFAGNFIHLHSTSMFLLDAFLEIDQIRCFEVNIDALGPPVKDMAPFFQRVQAAGKPLLIRGSITEDEMGLLLDALEPRGLFMNIMVNGMPEIERLRPLLGM